MTEIDQARLERFVGRAVGDMAAAISGLLVHLGDQLGLYRTMAGAGPVTPEALAGQTGTAARYVREWLSNQAATLWRRTSPRSAGRSTACPP
jgi:hypothetical protein